MIDPVIAWVARSGLALLFGLAALHKTRDLRAFATVVRGYRLVPERVAPLLAASATACEAALVVALLLPGAASQAALAAALLLLFYSGAIGWNLARGRRSIDGSAASGPRGASHSRPGCCGETPGSWRVRCWPRNRLPAGRSSGSMR